MSQASIWVDADACPVVIKEILYRAAMRTATTTTLVANQPLQTPGSPYIQSLQVGQGFDVADGEICQRLSPGDLVVTGDIPLAAEAIELGATALDPRGEYHTSATIRSRLNMRDFMETMRSAGLHTSGAPPLSQTDRQRFANALDRWLQKQR